jgi:replication factor C subunit 3/5
MNQPLTEKYRPQTLGEIVGSEEVVQSLSTMSASGSIPHMLFYGPPGTGKTTAARALSRRLPIHSVLELNASDERGIDVVRERIKEFASTYSGTARLVILDEADMMSRDAQNALRRIIEDFSRTTRFCLIANYSKKIIPAVLSRCTKLRFSPVRNSQQRIRVICQKEGIDYDEQGVNAIADAGDGDLRKIINDIQGVAASFGSINRDSVLSFNGIVADEVYCELFEELKKGSMDDLKHRLRMLDEVYGADCDSLIRRLSGLVRNSTMRSKMDLLKELAEIECRRSSGCSQGIQSAALVSAFILNRDLA